MLFKVESIDAIVRGEKTQTRRTVKISECNPDGLLINGEIAVDIDGNLVISHLGERMSDKPIHAVYTVHRGKRRLKWQVGRDYAVQPGRVKPGAWWNQRDMKWALPGDRINYYNVGGQDSIWQGWHPLRFIIKRIRREPLQAISEEDSIAEGWEQDEDKRECPHCDAPGDYYGPDLPCFCDPITWYRYVWESINGKGSWDRNPDVWCLTFEVKRD